MYETEDVDSAEGRKKNPPWVWVKLRKIHQLIAS